jgi:hypothetical protein
MTLMVLAQTIHRLGGFARRRSNILTSSGLVPRNVRALSDARFLRGAKLDAVLCARSIKPFGLNRSRGIGGVVVVSAHPVILVAVPQ